MRSCQVSQESALKYLKKLELQGLDLLGPSEWGVLFLAAAVASLPKPHVFLDPVRLPEKHGSG
jgi:hypothetical protein